MRSGLAPMSENKSRQEISAACSVYKTPLFIHSFSQQRTAQQPTSPPPCRVSKIKLMSNTKKKGWYKSQMYILNYFSSKLKGVCLQKLENIFNSFSIFSSFALLVWWFFFFFFWGCVCGFSPGMQHTV